MRYEMLNPILEELLREGRIRISGRYSTGNLILIGEIKRCRKTGPYWDTTLSATNITTFLENGNIKFLGYSGYATFILGLH
jgi:hypothetical protein